MSFTGNAARHVWGSGPGLSITCCSLESADVCVRVCKLTPHQKHEPQMRFASLKAFVSTHSVSFVLLSLSPCQSSIAIYSFSLFPFHLPLALSFLISPPLSAPASPSLVFLNSLSLPSNHLPLPHLPVEFVETRDRGRDEQRINKKTALKIKGKKLIWHAKRTKIATSTLPHDFKWQSEEKGKWSWEPHQYLINSIWQNMKNTNKYEKYKQNMKNTNKIIKSLN